MVRVIYLLALTDIAEHQRLMQSTVRGEKWVIKTAGGKFRTVTDRDMINLPQHLQGWTQSVYRFGCGRPVVWTWTPHET